MNANTSTPAAETPLPPKILQTFKIGFDIVANHIYLIWMPLVLDLFLWFGPHIRLNSLLQPLLDEMRKLPPMDNVQMNEMVKAGQQYWSILAEHLNLASFLRTYPIGVPSIMFSIAPIQTPLGNAQMVEVGGPLSALAWWGLFGLLGLVATAFYYNSLARTVNHTTGPDSPTVLVFLVAQTLALTACAVLLLLILFTPMLVLAPLLALLGPGAMALGSLTFAMVVIWLILPLYFAPHGIFALRQNVITAMLTSARLVRFTLPGVALFLLINVVMGQGLNLLWESAPETSWMALVGVVGHAFVVTALITTSFVYYRDAIHWAHDLMQRKQAQRG
jgi:hypothetical protein